jgi:hypothetical protein
LIVVAGRNGRGLVIIAARSANCLTAFVANRRANNDRCCLHAPVIAKVIGEG